MIRLLKHLPSALFEWAPLVILLLVAIFAGYVRGMESTRDDIVRLEKDLSSAREEAARWRAVADTRAHAAEAQEALALACLAREAAAVADAAEIKQIMSGAEPRKIEPEETRQGVDHETRRRAVDMLNRPW